MVKNFFIFAFAMLLIVATGWLVYNREQSNADKTAASIGIAVGSPTPTPTPETGDIALKYKVNDKVNGSPSPSQTPTTANWCENPGTPESLKTGVQFVVCRAGTGEQATPGMVMAVDYTGRLESTGQVFDSSIGKKPLEFIPGMGKLIPGFEAGVSGMKVGERREIFIPWNQAYGDKEQGGIPPKSNLIFDVELIAVKPMPVTK